MRKIYFIFFIGLLISCNSEKAAQRKDAAALNRVETNIKLLTSAYARALKLYPCVNDSVTINKTDTIVTKTIKTEIKRDTINKRDTVINTIEKIFHIRDSSRTIVKDQQGINALNDSVAAYRLQLANLSGSLIESRNIIEQDKKIVKELNDKIATGKTGLFIVVFLFIVATAAAAYLKFFVKI